MLTGLSQEIYEMKYKSDSDKNWGDTCRRVCKFVSNNENEKQALDAFNLSYNAMYNLTFLPGGRITEGAGNKNPYLLNCYALDIEDTLEDIYEKVKQVAIISKKNGGCGLSFNKIRPKNAKLSSGGTGSGPVSFMKIFDASCSVIKTGSKNRRAALISILDVSHPDIFEYIEAKREENVLTNFNISVGVTDKFIYAVKNDLEWDLVFGGEVYETVMAKEIWEKLIYSGWMYNDPGIILHDEINRSNSMAHKYLLYIVNPCGELSLRPDGACDLGNINLTKMVIKPFKHVTNIDEFLENFDMQKWIDAIGIGVRFLDNVLDTTEYPYEQNKNIAMEDRRIGLNPWSGIGSFLAMNCIPYDSKLALEVTDLLGSLGAYYAYSASIELAKEKGAFPNLGEYKSSDRDAFVYSSFIAKIDLAGEKIGKHRSIIEDILYYGIRNCAILTVPPVGTGSLLMGNISNGIEPIFSLEYNRTIKQPEGPDKIEPVEDYAWGLYKKENPLSWQGHNGAIIAPDFFKTSRQIDPKSHIDLQASIQYYCDGNISKTVNLPADYTIEDYSGLLMYAINSGVHGIVMP